MSENTQISTRYKIKSDTELNVTKNENEVNSSLTSTPTSPSTSSPPSASLFVPTFAPLPSPTSNKPSLLSSLTDVLRGEDSDYQFKGDLAKRNLNYNDNDKNIVASLGSNSTLTYQNSFLIQEIITKLNERFDEIIKIYGEKQEFIDCQDLINSIPRHLFVPSYHLSQSQSQPQSQSPSLSLPSPLSGLNITQNGSSTIVHSPFTQNTVNHNNSTGDTGDEIDNTIKNNNGKSTDRGLFNKVHSTTNALVPSLMGELREINHNKLKRMQTENEIENENEILIKSQTLSTSSKIKMKSEVESRSENPEHVTKYQRINSLHSSIDSEHKLLSSPLVSISAQSLAQKTPIINSKNTKIYTHNNTHNTNNNTNKNIHTTSTNINKNSSTTTTTSTQIQITQTQTKTQTQIQSLSPTVTSISAPTSKRRPSFTQSPQSPQSPLNQFQTNDEYSNNSTLPYQSTQHHKHKTRKQRAKAPPLSSDLYCRSCGETQTCEWRRGPDGYKSLCNACGIHYAKIVKKEETATANYQPKGSVDLTSILN